jgi:hypothetical protein
MLIHCRRDYVTVSLSLSLFLNNDPQASREPAKVCLQPKLPLRHIEISRRLEPFEPFRVDGSGQLRPNST